MPLLDSFFEMQLNPNENQLERTKQALSELQPGITHFVIHPSKDTPDLRAMTPTWRYRVADYQNFMNDDMRQYIQNIGVQVIGYRALKELLSAA